MQKFTITPDQARIANQIAAEFFPVIAGRPQTGGIKIMKTVVSFVPCSSAKTTETVQDALNTFLHHAVEVREAIVLKDGHAKNTVAVNALIRKTLKALDAEKAIAPAKKTPAKKTAKKTPAKTSRLAKPITARPVNHGHVLWGAKSQRFIAHVKIDGAKSRKRFLTEDEAQAYCDLIMGAPVAA